MPLFLRPPVVQAGISGLLVASLTGMHIAQPPLGLGTLEPDSGGNSSMAGQLGHGGVLGKWHRWGQLWAFQRSLQLRKCRSDQEDPRALKAVLRSTHSASRRRRRWVTYLWTVRISSSKKKKFKINILKNKLLFKIIAVWILRRRERGEGWALTSPLVRNALYCTHR